MNGKQLQVPQLQYDFDAMRAKLARDAAVAHVDEHADDAWKIAARAAVQAVSLRRAEFTTDDVLEVLRTQPVATHEGRALGPVMLHAARMGWVENTRRFQKSNAVSRHNAPKTVWRSLLFRNP